MLVSITHSIYTFWPNCLCYLRTTDLLRWWAKGINYRERNNKRWGSRGISKVIVSVSKPICNSKHIVKGLPSYIISQIEYIVHSRILPYAHTHPYDIEESPPIYTQLSSSSSFPPTAPDDNMYYYYYLSFVLPHRNRSAETVRKSCRVVVVALPC